VYLLRPKSSLINQVFQKSYLQVKSNLNELARILAWFNGLYQPIIPRSVLVQCQTVLVEAFTNAVRHAHQGRPHETPIDIEVSLLEHCLELRVWDQGPAFDLEQKLRNLPKPTNPNRTGGRGIQIIAHLSDSFSYTRMPGDRNCLLMIKHYSSE
jgi:serine/threonine-protein kinase RsbW